MAIPKRILVIRSGGLGDFILSLPAIRALAYAWPGAELEILGRPSIAVLSRSQFARITSIDDHRFARLFSDAPLDVSDWAGAYLSSFDLVVSFLGAADSDFGKKLRALVPRTLFIPPPGVSERKHAAIHFLESLRLPHSGEFADDRFVPRIDLPGENIEEGRRVLERLLGSAGDNRTVVVHPGSGGRRKNWPSQLFVETVRLFRGAGHKVILLQGEADEEAVGEVLRHIGVPVLKDASLLQVAGAIACSQLVVGNDSGISHLAAALGSPLVCVFGPTEPDVWRPLGTAVRVLTFDEATPERVYTEGLKLISPK